MSLTIILILFGIAFNIAGTWLLVRPLLDYSRFRNQMKDQDQIDENDAIKNLYEDPKGVYKIEDENELRIEKAKIERKTNATKNKMSLEKLSNFKKDENTIRCGAGLITVGLILHGIASSIDHKIWNFPYLSEI